MKRKRLTLTQQRSNGLPVYTAFHHWVHLVFLAPFIQSVIFSLNHLRIVTGGYELIYNNWENYKHALFVDTNFLPTFTQTLLNMLLDVPAIIFFSFFAALLLNQKFKGRLLARSIFFLPVILSSGVIVGLEAGDYMANMMRRQLPQPPVSCPDQLSQSFSCR